MNIDDRRPTTDLTHFGKISNGHNSATRQPIPFMFGSRVGRRIERRHFRLAQIQDSGPLADGGHFQKFQMAISQQRVVRFFMYEHRFYV